MNSEVKVGIVGVPNIGKSTLFSVVSDKQVKIGNYAFCTIEPNVAIVEVMDDRVDNLAVLSKSKKKIYNTIEFIDIAGLIKSENDSERAFLSNISQVDLILHVVRCFQDKDIIHMSDHMDPLGDIEIIKNELRQWDIEKLEKIRKKFPYKIDNDDIKTKKAMEDSISCLRDNRDLSSLLTDENRDEMKKFFKSLSLISYKPVLFALNISHQEQDEYYLNIVQEYCERNNEEFVVFNGKSALLKDLSQEERWNLFRDKENPMQYINNLIVGAYRKLDLISFFTTGVEETRAWKIKKNTLAPDAAEKIHTDFKKKFICVDVCKYNDFINGNSKFINKGKNYIVEDGDICIFKINRK